MGWGVGRMKGTHRLWELTQLHHVPGKSPWVSYLAFPSLSPVLTCKMEAIRAAALITWF